MILSFRDKETERVYRQQWSTRLPGDIQSRALRKLLLLDAAESEADLRSPPGNRLERLKGDRAGEFSIRVNRQWRICFRFRDGHARDVGIEDYHE